MYTHEPQDLIVYFFFISKVKCADILYMRLYSFQPEFSRRAI